MNFNDYQKQSRATAQYPHIDNNFIFPLLGLSGETGEVADKFKKYIRDHGVATPADITDAQKADLSKEMGDVLWYLAQLATELDLSLQDIAEGNLTKTQSRQERNVVHGVGDDR